MEHDRIATLVRETPPGLPEARPDPHGLLLRARRRRVRRLAAGAAATALAVIGLALPLALLAGVGAGPSRAPAGSGLATSISTTTAGSGGTSTGGSLPDVGVFRCTADGVEVDTPEFAVQADGVHLRVENPGGAPVLVLRRVGTANQMPVDISGSAETTLVTPYAEPGPHEAACAFGSGADDGVVGPVVGEWTPVRIADPAGMWTSMDLGCADSSERVVLATMSVEDRAALPGSIRDAVTGFRATDRIVPAGYPESDEGIAFLVRRDGAEVAVIRILDRGRPIAEALDVTSCDGSGIGDGQGARR